MHRILLILAVCSLCALPAAAAPDVDVEGLKGLLATERESLGAEAVLFGMWRGDREILTHALGHSMTTVPASTAMHWRIGGFSETFMSTLLLMLAEKGRIDLDEPISRWLPDLLSADQVTARMLISNTAGYLDYVRNDAFDKLNTAEPFRQFTSDELIAYSVEGGKMNYPPGTSQAYSHTEFIILGKVMEAATGQSMKELYEQYILVPHGFADTRFPVDQEIQAPVLHAFSSDRGVYEDSTYWNPFWGGPNGVLTSNLHDLGRWVPMFGTGALLSPASFRAQTAPSSLGRNRPNLYFAYGFLVANGWYVQNPSMNGYSGALAYHPPTKTTLVVAATQAPDATTHGLGIALLKKVVAFVAPETPLNF